MSEQKEQQNNGEFDKDLFSKSLKTYRHQNKFLLTLNLSDSLGSYSHKETCIFQTESLAVIVDFM